MVSKGEEKTYPEERVGQGVLLKVGEHRVVDLEVGKVG